MRHAILALALLSLAAAPQDPAKDDIARWTSELGSDDVDKRNEAQKKLTEAGVPARDAVKALLTSDDPEVKNRATQIVRDIDDRAAAGDTLKSPTVTCDLHDAALDAILASWTAQTKVEFQIDATIDKIPAFKCDRMPLMQALDTLCAASGNIMWTRAGANKIKIASGKWIARPCAYDGPVRVTVMTIRETRTNDFEKDAGGSVAVFLRVDSLFDEKPWKENLEATGATLSDDKPAKVGPPTAADNAGVWAGQMQVFIQAAGVAGGNTADDPGREFVVRDVPRSVGAIKSLSGSVELSIPIGTEEITLSSDDVGKTKEIGETKIRVNKWKGGQARIRITPKDFKDPGDNEGNGNVMVWSNVAGAGGNALKDELERRVDLASIKGAEAHGEPHKLEAEIKGGREGQNGVVIMGGGNFQVDSSGAAPELVVDIPKDDSIEKITFKLKTRTYKHRLAFRIPDIKLP